jgi:hypothetical protein
MTRASRDRLGRRFAQKRPGRKAGTHFPLLQDPQRHTIAGYFAFAQALPAFEAAQLAIVLIEERTPISIADAEGLLLVLSATFDPGAARTQVLGERARLLMRKARRIAEIVDDREKGWLQQSAGSLVGLCSMFADDDHVGVARALRLLKAAGWDAVIERLRKRLDAALRSSNFPPFEGRLRKAGRALVDRARKRSSLKGF